MTQGHAEDPFAVLGLPRSFDLTPAQVQGAYLRVMAQLHPDLARDPLERDDRLRRTAAAGEARQRLASPIGRAEALLAGVQPSAEGVLPPAFLAQTLQLRMRMEEAQPKELDEIRELVAGMRAACIEELGQALARQAWQEAHRALAQLRYIERMAASLQGAPLKGP